MSQLFGVIGVIIMVIATVTYLPENIVCQLDDSCSTNVTESNDYVKTVDSSQENKVLLNLLADGLDAIRNVVNP